MAKSKIDVTICIQCASCLDNCKHNAVKMSDSGFPEIDPALCQGCEVCDCKDNCPVGAIERY